MDNSSPRALTWQRADEPVHVLHVPRAGVSRQEVQREDGQVVALAVPPLLGARGGGHGAGGGGGRRGRRRSVERLVERAAPELRTLRRAAEEARRGKNAGGRFPIHERRLRTATKEFGSFRLKADTESWRPTSFGTLTLFLMRQLIPNASASIMN